MFDGVIRSIECWHVSGIKRNLISLSTLDSQGYKYHAEGSVLKVCMGSMILIKGSLVSGLYVLQGSVITGEAATASGSDDQDLTQLWHMRLGHMSDKGLSILGKQNLLSGYKGSGSEFCEHCVFGKQTWVKFSKTAVHSIKGKLDYILSDLWGPNKVASKSGARYYMTLIDDY